MPRFAHGQSSAAPCVSASAACTEWIAVEAQPQRVLVYRSYPLDRQNKGIVRGLVMLHGGLRLAADQFTNELAAAFLSEALDDTILIAPRFASNTTAACMDVLAAQEANWICEDARADSWRNGSPMIGHYSS
jgi:hypothetical protein